MINKTIRAAIQASLLEFATQSPAAAARDLFAILGYRSERTIPTSTIAEFCENYDKEGYLEHPTALKAEWKFFQFLFQLTDEELSGQHSLFEREPVNPDLMKSYSFFVIELTGDHYSRGKLAGITRRINRVFSMPVMVLFKIGDKISMAVINRRRSKMDVDKAVLGKVTLIQDINYQAPHPGHLDILASFSIPELRDRKKPVGNFDQLHAAWEEVFNVELLNKRFYQELSNWYFWARHRVQFPADLEPDEQQRNSTSIIRLLTRIIFCWFLKEKGLIPDDLFDKETVGKHLTTLDKDESTYYRAILQNLFFATLNQKMNSGGKIHRRFAGDSDFRENRDHYGVKNLYRYKSSFRDPDAALRLFQDIPFLNGGLFACLDPEDENGRVQYADGFSRNEKKQPVVPNDLFFAEPKTVDLSQDYGETKRKTEPVRGLISILRSYKFTIAENTPVEQEIALDPELLGKVFENLLASYNPETGTTARKQTGSFYTPRPIVDYMVDESLKAHLAQELVKRVSGTKEADARVGLDILFAYTEKEHAFTAAEVTALIAAIHDCNILDPACGSGAFPMGVLHKLVFILEKLDPNNRKWYDRQIAKAEEIEDVEARESSVNAIRSDFEENSLDYGRKLYLIENCIYGVDIQPIAIQIAKLRFFISLVCDQKTNNNKEENHGVKPLPNLETKFVAADTLIGLTTADEWLPDRDVEALVRQLEKVRHRHFFAQTRQQKLAVQSKDRELRAQLAEKLKDTLMPADAIRKIVDWNPYDHFSSAGFFDPKWMFGSSLAAGFDVVLGNPPYVQIQKFTATQKAAWTARKFETYAPTGDVYCLFYERGARLLKPGGHLAFITSNKWLKSEYGKKLRGYLAREMRVEELIDFRDLPVFQNVIAYPLITIAAKCPLSGKGNRAVATRMTLVSSLAPPFPDVAELARQFGKCLPPDSIGKDGKWNLETGDNAIRLAKMRASGITLGEYVKGQIYYGIKTGLNEVKIGDDGKMYGKKVPPGVRVVRKEGVFIINGAKRAELIAEDPKSAEIIKPLARGRDIRRWVVEDNDCWLIVTKIGTDMKRYPAVMRHLNKYKERLEPRADQGEHWWELRACAYYEAFDNALLIFPDISMEPRFALTSPNVYVEATAFLISNPDLYLAGVMGSSTFLKIVKANVPAVQNGFLRFKKAYLMPLVIPNAGKLDRREIEELVQNLIRAKVETGSDVSALEEELDARVEFLYFHSDEAATCDEWIASKGEPCVSRESRSVTTTSKHEFTAVITRTKPNTHGQDARATASPDSSGDTAGMFQAVEVKPQRFAGSRAAAPDIVTEIERKRSMNDISREEALARIRKAFMEFGTREGAQRGQAIKAVSEMLGFDRLGKNIREELEGDMRTAVRRRIIESVGGDGTYRLATRTIEDYLEAGRDKYASLRKYLCAAVGARWTPLDDAINQTARYLGFARTGENIRAVLETAIKSAVRRGEVEKRAGEIRSSR